MNVLEDYCLFMKQNKNTFINLLLYRQLFK